MSSSIATSSSRLSSLILRVDTEKQQVIYSDSKRLAYLIDHEGNMWFPASETAIVLEYENPWKAIRDHIDKVHPEYVTTLKQLFEKGNVQIPNESFGSCTSRHARPCRSRPAGTLPKNKANKKYINEGGFFQLALRSKMKAAIKFQSWVCEEVLPAIRKTGRYSLIPEPQIPTTTVAVDEISDLQTRVDAISITKKKCDIIKATIPNATPNDYAVVHDVTNQVSLMTTSTTAEIKREYGVAKGLTIPDVLNDCSQERRIYADFFLIMGLYKKKRQLASLPPKEREVEMRSMREEIQAGVDTAPFIERGEVGVIPNDVAKKRKREQKERRKTGALEPSPRAAISAAQMEQAMITDGRQEGEISSITF